jgi:hypothetical protein
MQIVSVRLTSASFRRAWLIRRLETDVRITHLALDLNLQRQRCYRVDRDDVERSGAPGLRVSALLPGVQLRDRQVVDVEPILFAYVGSIACSASMRSRCPPRWASAITW